YAPAGYFGTGWIRLGMYDISKLFNAIRYVVSLENTSANVSIWYQLDNENNAWTFLGKYDTSTISRDLALDSTTYNKTGKQIRFRFQLDTVRYDSGVDSRCSMTPRLMATVLEALAT